MELEELLLGFIESKDEEKLMQLLADNHPIDIALAIENFDDNLLSEFIHMVDDEYMSYIFQEASENLQIIFMDIIEPSRIVRLFSFMSPDDIADILGFIPFKNRKVLLNLMKKSDSNELHMLLGYDEDTAGGIMTTQYIALKNTLSTKDALIKIKHIGPKTEVIETIFVVNSANILMGTADLRDILISSEDTLLDEIMNENVISVNPHVDQEEVSLIVSKYDLRVLPVVNNKGSILGIITVDDVIDVIVDEHTEDFLALSGVNKNETFDSKLSISLKRRLPWLMVNLVTAFIASFTISLFEGVIAQVVALAAAMPIVTGMGGNAGSQSLSVVIRSIALGEINLEDHWKIVFKEMALGLVEGITTGLFAGIILAIRYNNVFLGLIIMASLSFNLMISGFFGFLIPLILKKLNLDPAVSSAVFLTTATDVLGFFAFLGLSKMFLPLLL